jgi:predicted ArsR family transcriptional regulator
VDELGEQAASIGVLADPVRRALYRYVVEQPEPVSREQAASAVDMPLHSVKFHLDRLLDAGLLDAEYRRLSARTGPGAGRPSKVYRRSSRQVSVSLPERRYDLAGEVLAEAVHRSARDGGTVADAVHAAATEAGHRIAAETAVDPRSDAGDLDTVGAVLSRWGYAPRTVDDELRLTNCPFDRLAVEHTDLICGMNLALVDGLLDALGTSALRALLAPTPGCCCVRVVG